MKPPPPPVLSYEDIRARADDFLVRHWPEGTLPVDIEKIVDVRLGLDIVTLRGLRRECGVDGFLAAGGRAVYVDEEVADHVPNRYRFTLAHEVGHRELHQALYAHARFRTPAEWLAYQEAIPEKDHSWYEYQAYSFAGLVLAPRRQLRERVDEALALAARKGYTVDLRAPADRQYVADWVARKLGVSDAVVLRRGKADGLWDEL